MAQNGHQLAVGPVDPLFEFSSFSLFSISSSSRMMLFRMGLVASSSRRQRLVGSETILVHTNHNRQIIVLVSKVKKTFSGRGEP